MTESCVFVTFIGPNFSEKFLSMYNSIWKETLVSNSKNRFLNILIPFARKFRERPLISKVVRVSVKLHHSLADAFLAYISSTSQCYEASLEGKENTLRRKRRKTRRFDYNSASPILVSAKFRSA